MHASGRSIRLRISPGCAWAFGGGAVGLLLLILALTVCRMRGAALNAQVRPETVVTVIPMPSATARLAIPPTEIIGSPVPSGTIPPADPDLILGGLVEISGTGGDGLRLREGPGLDAPVKFLGLENEVFEVREGPVEQDGFIWWLLQNPYDQSKFGWAVGRYLRTVEP